MNFQEKINFEELVKDFRIDDQNGLYMYLGEVWKDLSRRSKIPWKGLIKETFKEYYVLPGIIGDRLFDVLNNNKDEYLGVLDFLQGMANFFICDFHDLAKFIFKLYDSDNDGLITQEDVRVILSYLPVETKLRAKFHLKYELEDFNDRAEAVDEIDILLKKAFGDKKTLNEEDFLNVICNVNSDIFIYLLLFLLEKRPFVRQALDLFENHEASKCKTPILTKVQHKIASPTMKSKFKSPTLKQRMLQNGKGVMKYNSSILSKYAGKPIELRKAEEQKDSKENEKNGETNPLPDDNINLPQRRDRKNLENLDDKISPHSESEQKTKHENDQESDSEDEEEHENNNESDINLNELTIEGSLFKVTKTQKVKKLYFKLVGKDLFYYKNPEEKIHNGLHNLSGVFLQENGLVTIKSTQLYSFSLVCPKKTRNYYLMDKSEYERWVQELEKVIGKATLNDKYEIKGTLGKGKYGIVKLGIHKQSQRKVAIKIIHTKGMSEQDQECVKREIDILKISKQPNIIKLYDVVETPETTYIIMEYCNGGDLFSYIAKRGFRLPEQRVAEIIHKLSTAVFFLHKFFIVHRDLKPENILVKNTTQMTDMKLADFGLSKIILPGEKCNEPFGTLSYVAPEVLTRTPYDQKVDSWSIGIITYLLLSGCLPFDDRHSEREIARKIVKEEVPFYPSRWDNVSEEAKIFVKSLLQKDPNKRLSVQEILEHDWMKKYFGVVVTERKKSVDIAGSNFKLYASVNPNSN